MKKISALIISMALLFSTSVMGVSAKETVETKELYAAEQGETKKRVLRRIQTQRKFLSQATVRLN